MSQSHAYRFDSLKTNKSNLNCEELAFICNSNDLQKLFKGEIDINRKKRFTKTLVGSSSGIFLTYPASTGASV